MICTYCGKEIPDGSKFCTYCGKEQKTIIREETNNDNESKINPLIIVVIVVVVIAALGGGLYFFLNKDKTIVVNGTNTAREIAVEENYEPVTTTNEENKNDSTIVAEQPKRAYRLEITSTMKIRDLPSTAGQQVGKIQKGSSLIGFETQKGEGYTWYRIGTDQWVANDGTWMNVSFTEIDINDDNNDYGGTRIRILEPTDIYQSPSMSSTKVAYLEESSIVDYYEHQTIDGANWYRIGTEQWFIDTGSNFKLYEK